MTSYLTKELTIQPVSEVSRLEKYFNNDLDFGFSISEDLCLQLEAIPNLQM